MANSDKIASIRQKIDEDIERAGGVEDFNKSDYAHEVITNWIEKILNVIESDGE